jgi:hypothetical protein
MAFRMAEELLAGFQPEFEKRFYSEFQSKLGIFQQQSSDHQHSQHFAPNQSKSEHHAILILFLH